MAEYKIHVKKWMTNYDTFMDENSFLRKTNSSPMPMCIMYGKKLNETPKMIQMELYADIKEEVCTICMKCGKKLTNPVSKYFGIGPECGHHNYINPFNSDKELQKAIGEMKIELNQIKWTGWIMKSGIIDLQLINGDPDKDLIKPKEELIINIKIEKSNKCNEEYSLFISFPYNASVINIIKQQPIRYYNPETKEWELPLKSLDNLKKSLSAYDVYMSKTHEDLFRAIFNNQTTSYIPKDYKFKITPFKHQIEGVEYGLKYNRFLLGDEQRLAEKQCKPYQ